MMSIQPGILISIPGSKTILLTNPVWYSGQSNSNDRYIFAGERYFDVGIQVRLIEFYYHPSKIHVSGIRPTVCSV